MQSIDIRIDEQFRNLIPPLSREERDGLEESIVKEGCRDPLVVWLEEGVLVDGHNRHEICRKHGIQFETREQSFASRDDATVWVIKNQLHRRNLSEIDRIRLAEQMAPLLEAKAKANLSAGGGDRKSPCQNSDKAVEVPIDTKKVLAKAAGVSHDTYLKGRKILQGGAGKLVDAVRDGEVSINAASALLELPKEQQEKVVADGKDTVKQAVKAIHANRTAKQRKAKSVSSHHMEMIEKSRDLPMPEVDPRYAEYAAKLEKMPIRRIVSHSRFDADAALYWSVISMVERCRREAMDLSGFKSPVAMGPFMLRVDKLVTTMPPEAWIICKPCNGAGRNNGICQSCNGSGYRVSSY